MALKKHSTVLLWVLIVAMWFAYVVAKHTTEPTSSDPTTTQKPRTVFFKRRLEQLKKMEESALKEWYAMVEKFLVLIKPDDEIIDVIMDYVEGTLHFEFPSAVVQLAKKNSVFLAMVSIGLAYVVVMLFAGLFFFFCRLCGRCGAKDTQRQTRSINCWKTTHKFCLVFMIAFLVVPITCMVIINEHMKQSFPSIKSNASSIFPMVVEFADSTEMEVNEIAKEELDNVIRRVTDKKNFEKGFETPLEEDISQLIDDQTLNNVHNFVTWILTVKNQYVPKIQNDITQMSNSIRDLKGIITNLTEETDRFKEHCSDAGNNICKIGLKRLSIEKLDVDSMQREAEHRLNELTNIKSETLENMAVKIQNNTLLRSIIKEKSKDLDDFARGLNPKQDEILKKIKSEVKKYADYIREYAKEGQRSVDFVVGKADDYELYRWWFMMGITIVLLIPVLFLIMGLVCGCCGYRKGYHPSKRSSTSNCGGICLILAVYYFFLVAWLLMMVTVALFVVGGNIQSFICIPLYQKNFDILDQVNNRLTNSYPEGKTYFVPSKVLNDCQDDMSIFVSLNSSIMNDNSANILKKELEKKLQEARIESELKNSIASETMKIQRQLDSFLRDLDVSQIKDLPNELQSTLEEVKRNIQDTKEQVKKALSENESNDLEGDLRLIDNTALSLLRTVDDFELKLKSFSSTLKQVYDEATDYKVKISVLKTDLKTIEQKVPELVHNRLFQYVVGVVNTDISEKLQEVGRCESLWLAFDTARTVACDFIVYPVNGFWFGLGWSLIFIIPTIIFAVKLSRHYIKMKYDDDLYRHDEREALPLDEMNRIKPFSYTNPGTMGWMPQNYMVHPTSGNHIRQFDYK